MHPDPVMSPLNKSSPWFRFFRQQLTVIHLIKRFPIHMVLDGSSPSPGNPTIWLYIEAIWSSSPLTNYFSNTRCNVIHLYMPRPLFRLSKWHPNESQISPKYIALESIIFTTRRERYYYVVWLCVCVGMSVSYLTLWTSPISDERWQLLFNGIEYRPTLNFTIWNV